MRKTTLKDEESKEGDAVLVWLRCGIVIAVRFLLARIETLRWRDGEIGSNEDDDGRRFDGRW